MYELYLRFVVASFTLLALYSHFVLHLCASYLCLPVFAVIFSWRLLMKPLSQYTSIILITVSR